MSTSGEDSYPVLHLSPLTLQELAARRIALHLWLKVHHDKPCYGKSYFGKISELRPMLNTCTKIPRKIKNPIEFYFKSINRELESWYENVKQLKTFQDCFRSRFDLVVFGGDGTVHYHDTAENFFKDGRLSDLAKFEMACMNCMEEKVDFYWNLIGHTLKSEEACKLHFEGDPLIDYWIYRQKGELNLMPLQGFNSVSDLMIKTCLTRLVHTAIEYYTKSLVLPESRAKRVRTHRKLNDDDFRWTINKTAYLVPYCEVSEQRYAFRKFGTGMLATFFQDLNMKKHVLQTWLNIRDFFTAEQFYNTVIRNCLNVREAAIGTSKYAELDELLAEIWSDTPFCLKTYALNFTSFLFRYDLYKDDYGSYFNKENLFLSAVLSDIQVPLSNNLWTENWPTWIRCVPIPQNRLEELKMRCFEGILPHTKPFQRFARMLMYLGLHGKLYEFVDGLYSNPNDAFNIKKRILNNHIEIFSANYEVIEKHAKCIDLIFSNQTEAAVFKYQLISSAGVLNLVFDRFRRSCDSDIEPILQLFVSAAEYEEIKEHFLAILRDRISKKSIFFMSANWLGFLKWCVDDDERRLNKFRRSLPISDIFEKVFSHCLNYPSLMAPALNDLSLCCFETKNVFEKFLRKQLAQYETMNEADIERCFNESKTKIVNSIKSALFVMF